MRSFHANRSYGASMMRLESSLLESIHHVTAECIVLDIFLVERHPLPISWESMQKASSILERYSLRTQAPAIDPSLGTGPGEYWTSPFRYGTWYCQLPMVRVRSRVRARLRDGLDQEFPDNYGEGGQIRSVGSILAK